MSWRDKTRTKLFWIEQLLYCYLTMLFAYALGYVPEYLLTVAAAASAPFFLWGIAIRGAMHLGVGLGGVCAHCGGDFVLHLPETINRPDGACLCKVPDEFCDCLGYQPSRRWLDNNPLENRDDAYEVGGISH